MTGASGEHTSSLESVAAFPPQLEIMVAAACFRAALLQGDSLLLELSACVPCGPSTAVWHCLIAIT